VSGSLYSERDNSTRSDESSYLQTRRSDKSGMINRQTGLPPASFFLGFRVPKAMIKFFLTVGRELNSSHFFDIFSLLDLRAGTNSIFIRDESMCFHSGIWNLWSILPGSTHGGLSLQRQG
jgi:hypothetical protein